MTNFRDYFKKARKEGWAVGKFNFSNAEGLRAIFQASQRMKSPVIVETSEGESKFLGLRQAAGLFLAWVKETGLPAVLNLDHAESFEYIKEAIDSGYGMVHFDGSKLPLKDNISLAKRVAAYARKKNVMVEGEVGFIQGASRVLKEAPKLTQADLTDPGEAEQFVKETKVDSLAINIGTFHGIEASGQNPSIDLERLKEIKNKIGDKAFLILHGGSGTQEEDIRKAISLGITGININTELRMAFADNLRKALEVKPEEIVPYNIMPGAIEAMQKVVEEKIKLFGSDFKV